MARALLVTWIVLIAYYALRVSVFALPSTCPGTVWEYSDDPRCDDGVLLDWLWFASIFVAAVFSLGYGMVRLLSRPN